MKSNAIGESTVCSSALDGNKQAPANNAGKGQKIGDQTWLTGKEVCDILHITSRTLQNYRDRKDIAYSQTGSKIYYRESDIQAYLEKNYIKACS